MSASFRAAYIPVLERQPERARRGYGLSFWLVLLGALGALRVVTANKRVPALPNPIAGSRRRIIQSRTGRLAVYDRGRGPPVLAIHSINGAASAYEVRPFFERIPERTVYALELPGFGNSDRGPRRYDPELFSSAIIDAAALINRETGSQVDGIALSLSSEYLCAAALLRPDLFRSLTLVTPTGFETRLPRRTERPSLRRLLSTTFLGPLLFDAVASRASIRANLMLTWGSLWIDEGLARYDALTIHQRGAETPVFDFLCGAAWPKNPAAIYERLSLPVWVPYGTRAAFHSFENVGAFAQRPSWQFEPFDCGAFPHFQMPEVFFRSLHTHLAPEASLSLREASKLF